MSTSTSSGPAAGKVYGPPTIPDTPSTTINKMLQQRCNHKFTNPVKAGIMFYICAVFQGITVLYRKINQEKDRESHTFWMISCGVVALAIVFKSFLVYQIIMACSFLIHALLYYGSIAVALFGIGLGVSGAVFFDKDHPSKAGSGTQDHSKYY